MNDFDKAIKILEKAQADLLKAYKTMAKFNAEHGLNEGHTRAVSIMLDNIESVNDSVDCVVTTCVRLSRQFN